MPLLWIFCGAAQALFIIPSLMTGGSLYQMSDIVGWLTSVAGKTTYVAIALFVVSGNIMSQGQLTEKIFNVFRYFLGRSHPCIPLVAVLTAIFLRYDFRFRYGRCCAVGANGTANPH